ncbi:uncharacterized protein LOC141639095 [Silene latifolia]|uniref:uncharacterized protein LOC141639095 n=1 Tax=Silene latifolia TaxID=37657 RepID=UPI003D76E857
MASPKNVGEIRSFLGLAGYYRRFVKDFSKIAKPLTSLMRKENRFVWDESCEKAFLTLKERLTTAPVLALPDGMITSKWKANVVADALSRKSIHALISARSRVRMFGELRQVRIYMIRRGETVGDMTVEPELYEEIRELQKEDARIQKWRNEVEQSGAEPYSKFEYPFGWELEVWEEVVCAANGKLKKKILTEAHATPYSVHPGGDKLYKDLKKTFWWPNMKKEVAEFVSRCLTCQRVKGEHKRPRESSPLDVRVEVGEYFHGLHRRVASDSKR